MSESPSIQPPHHRITCLGSYATGLTTVPSRVIVFLWYQSPSTEINARRSCLLAYNCSITIKFSAVPIWINKGPRGLDKLYFFYYWLWWLSWCPGVWPLILWEGSVKLEANFVLLNTSEFVIKENVRVPHFSS